MHPLPKYSCAFVTAPNITVARKIAAAALNERLAACVNLIPKVESLYWWQGKLESSSEVLMLFKTNQDKLQLLEQCVLKNHPYDTPEFIAVTIDQVNRKYRAWIDTS